MTTATTDDMPAPPTSRSLSFIIYEYASMTLFQNYITEMKPVTCEILLFVKNTEDSIHNGFLKPLRLFMKNILKNIT